MLNDVVHALGLPELRNNPLILSNGIGKVLDHLPIHDQVVTAGDVVELSPDAIKCAVNHLRCGTVRVLTYAIENGARKLLALSLRGRGRLPAGAGIVTHSALNILQRAAAGALSRCGVNAL